MLSTVTSSDRTSKGELSRPEVTTSKPPPFTAVSVTPSGTRRFDPDNRYVSSSTSVSPEEKRSDKNSENSEDTSDPGNQPRSLDWNRVPPVSQALGIRPSTITQTAIVSGDRFGADRVVTSNRRGRSRSAPIPTLYGPRLRSPPDR